MIPKPKADELIERIAEISPDRQPSEFTLKQIHREAQKLVSTGTDPAMGHSILGIVGALRLDKSSVLNHFRIAFDLSPDRVIRSNFVLAARRVGLHREALETALDIYHRYPDDVSILKGLHAQAVECLRWDIASDVNNRLVKLGINTSDIFPAEKFGDTAKLAESQGITHELILERILAASEIVHQAQEPLFGAVFDFALDGTLSYCIAIKNTPAVALDLSFAIAEKMVSGFGNPLADLITFSCVTYRNALHPTGLPEPSEETK